MISPALAVSRASLYHHLVAAKAKAKLQKTGDFFAVVGSDDGLVREKALLLYNQLTGGAQAFDAGLGALGAAGDVVGEEICVA